MTIEVVLRAAEYPVFNKIVRCGPMHELVPSIIQSAFKLKVLSTFLHVHLILIYGVYQEHDPL